MENFQNNRAQLRIQKKIRRVKLKETITLITEILLLILAIMLLLISVYFFIQYEPGYFK